MKEFLNALEKIAMFAEPNMIVTEKHASEVIVGCNTQMFYQIIGKDSITNEVIAVISNGYVYKGQGQQIIIVKGHTRRMFPFFGFNWTYLKK